MEKLALPLFLIACGISSLLIAISGIMATSSVYILLFGTVLVIAGFHFWKKNMGGSP